MTVCMCHGGAMPLARGPISALLILGYTTGCRGPSLQPQCSFPVLCLHSFIPNLTFSPIFSGLGLGLFPKMEGGTRRPEEG